MLNHGRLYDWLAQLGELSGLLRVYQTLVGPLPDEELTAENCCLIEQDLIKALEGRFPNHEKIISAGVLGDQLDFEVVPFQSFVHFGGYDPESDFEELPDLIKLVLCLAVAAGAGYYTAYEYEGETDETALEAWWNHQALRYQLPAFADLQESAIVDCMKALDGAAAPWDGLWAAWLWLASETGNLFVDISCAAANEIVQELFMECQHAWTMEHVEEMTRLYAWAREHVFDPMYELADYCDGHPEALGECFKRVFQGYRAVVQAAPKTLVELFAGAADLQEEMVDV
jgi:hypothetical protein